MHGLDEVSCNHSHDRHHVSLCPCPSMAFLIDTLVLALQLMRSADLTDHHVAVAAVLQLPHILRNAAGRSRRAAVMQHPLFSRLAKAVLGAIPPADLQVRTYRLLPGAQYGKLGRRMDAASAPLPGRRMGIPSASCGELSSPLRDIRSVQDLVALNAALAELDESSADASCLQALNLAADRLSALLGSGAHVPPHLLCQVASSCDLSAQHDASFAKARLCSHISEGYYRGLPQCTPRQA